MRHLLAIALPFAAFVAFAAAAEVARADLSPAAAAPEAIRYVDDDAAAGGDGRSWATAYVHLQDALAEARGAGGAVTEVRVAEGTYRPDAGAAEAPGDRDAAFALVAGVVLRGGYSGPGGGGDPDARDVAAFPTVLCGDLAGDDGPGFTARGDNSFHVVTAVDLGPGATLDGVTVRGGYADGPNFGANPESRDQGSGVNVYFSAPRFVDCTFEDNWALNHGALNDHGDSTLLRCTFRGNYADRLAAGLYVHVDALTTATACRFENNETAGKGGGAYNRGSTEAAIVDGHFERNRAGLGGAFYAEAGTATRIEGCTFIANDAATGGAMFNEDAATGIVDCTFADNTALRGEGGGAVWNQGGCVTITGCTFTGNEGIRGGAVYNGAGAGTEISGCAFVDNRCRDDGAGLSNDSSAAVVRDCTFVGNVALDGAFTAGGGMSNYFSTTLVSGCTFVGNSAFTGDFVGGGGMYIEAELDGRCVVASCTFLDNRAEVGGGLYTFRASPLVVNCLFARNAAVGGAFAVGGGVYNNFQSDPEIASCTLVENRADGSGGGLGQFASAPRLVNVIAWDNVPDQIAGDASSAPVVDYSTVEGGWDGTGAHNGSDDPRFVDPSAGDWRLGPGSPAIDAGHVWRLPPDVADLDLDGDVDELLPRDRAGGPRVTDDPAGAGTGCGPGPLLVDQGAFETAGPGRDPLRRADLDGSGAVDVGDLVTLLVAWGTCADDCCPGDIDGSGGVDVGDLLRLLADWG